MAHSNHSLRRGGTIEGINVTPLVDITLVLLLVFMVTADLMHGGALPLTLPHASQAARQPQAPELVIGVPAQGPCIVSGQPVSEAQLRERVRDVAIGRVEATILIDADQAAPHGRVLTVIDLLQAAGLTRVAFGARPSGAPEPYTASEGHGAAQ